MERIELSRYAKVVPGGNGQRGTTPTPEQLKIINHFTRTPFSADQLYVGQVDLANDQVDRAYERFTLSILRQFAQTIIGRGLLTGHDYSGLPEGAFFDAKVVKEGDVNWLRCWYYLPKTDENEHLRAMLDAGVFRYASIGFAPADGATEEESQLLCDICNAPMRFTPWGLEPSCDHWPGETYSIRNQEVRSIYHYDGNWQAIEGSIVYMGCQYGAEMKAHGEIDAEVMIERETESLAIARAAVFTKSVEGIACPRSRRVSPPETKVADLPDIEEPEPTYPDATPPAEVVAPEGAESAEAAIPAPASTGEEENGGNTPGPEAEIPAEAQPETQPETEAADGVSSAEESPAPPKRLRNINDLIRPALDAYYESLHTPFNAGGSITPEGE